MLIALFMFCIFAGCMLAASISDLTTMTIPNWISLVLIAGFFVSSIVVQQGWSLFGTQILVGLTFFFIGVAMFAMGWMGGGDAKLMAATSLWFVWGDMVYYLIYTALAGGLLALFLMFGRSFMPVRLLTTDWMLRLFKDEKKMPYGLALAFGGLMTFPQSEFFQYASLLT